ncbi:MAG: hypothetical protein Q9168_007458 [Polycauliona sp. 1 TL-2023]
MNTPTIINTLALLLSAAPLTLGLPQTAVTTGATVFWPWSDHADCAAPATACKADCTQAVKTLCAGDLGLGANTGYNFVNQTAGECTATYIYQISNNLPTADQCYNAFAYINDKGKPGPDGCGGTFGGSLGWDAQGNRTKDPIYAILPKGGNPNCFTTLDNSAAKPLAMDELPDGSKYPIDETCPTALSRRAKTGCVIGSVSLGVTCAAVCLIAIGS